MSEAKYGENNDVIIVPVFRFAHTGYLAKSIFYWEQYDSKPVLIFFRSSRHRNMK
ncbi:hypothetical protein COXBURSA331_A1957 [Coxiella burnetii RSA 331]|nr:hypothetical protein COXBURSA331_A1957 [Coxiella burnetii RSA 331]EDR35249.1 hypothetical protein COXBURSA334_0191 [Coxiella burnetii Q321]